MDNLSFEETKNEVHTDKQIISMNNPVSKYVCSLVYSLISQTKKLVSTTSGKLPLNKPM